MKRAVRTAWLSLAGLLAAMVLATAAGLIVPTTAGALPQAYTATVNATVRSGPSNAEALLGTLTVGQVVEATGPAVDGWLPITFNGTTAYVEASYVTESTTSVTTPVITGTPGTKLALVNINARAAASLDSEIVEVLLKGASIKVTGRTAGGFTEVTLGETQRWIFTKYLSPDTTSIVQPPPSMTMTTTANLAMRETPAVTAKSFGTLPTTSQVTITGKHVLSYTQIKVGDQLRWVLTGYLAPLSPDAPTFPKADGRRYVTASAVNVRAAADVNSTKITAVSRGTMLSITGVVTSNYTEVIYAGKARWVATSYLSTSVPSATGSLGSASLDKLNAYGKALVIEIREKFPQIKTIYGWRSYSAYSSDHPSGRGIDIMIPSYKSNRALGDAIATHLIANNKRLHVKYLIWRQRNYTISRGYWVSMSDRGGDTANHYDHVHVSVVDAP